MGRVTQQPPAPPEQPPVQAPEPQPVTPAKPHHVEEVKPIPVVEPPVAVHNLAETPPPTVISKPILPAEPVVIEIDPATVPQLVGTEITVSPDLIASVITVKPPTVEVVEMTTHVAVPVAPVVSVPPLQFPAFGFHGPLVPPPIEAKPDLPEPKKPVTTEPECLGRKLSPGDIVDGDILPPSEKKWQPAADNKTVRWFDMQWKSDGNYELVNWCVFMTHMELELRRL